MHIRLRPLIFTTTELDPDEVRIGTQVWKNTNLAVDDGGTGIARINNVTSGYDGTNFGTLYYYTPTAAARVVANIQGYHIPTQADWNTLFDYVNANGDSGNINKLQYNLNSTSGWYIGYDNKSYNGIDKYGFNSIPTGIVGEWDTSSATSIGVTINYIIDSTYCVYVDNTASHPYSISSTYYGGNTNYFTVRLIAD